MFNSSVQKLDQHLLGRYLRILGVTQRQPSTNALAELVAAHLTRVPFENISKLYYIKQLALYTIPDINIYLDGIERNQFSGTCYSNNYYFYTLLASQGYTIKLCGADMRNLDAHMVCMVEIEGREYLVDVGYAAPFLSSLPRDLNTDYTILLGCDRYVLKPQDAKGCSRLELYRNGVLKHGYLAKPKPKKIEDFLIKDTFREDATFINTILLARFFLDRSIVIHNLTVIDSQGIKSRKYSLKDRNELEQAVEEHFGISQAVMKIALSGLRNLNDAWN